MPEKRSFLLRLPPDLWEEIKRWASAELRSVNGQIEYVLREAVQRRRGERTDSTPDLAADDAPDDQDE